MAQRKLINELKPEQVVTTSATADVRDDVRKALHDAALDSARSTGRQFTIIGALMPQCIGVFGNALAIALTEVQQSGGTRKLPTIKVNNNGDLVENLDYDKPIGLNDKGAITNTFVAAVAHALTEEYGATVADAKVSRYQAEHGKVIHASKNGRAAVAQEKAAKNMTDAVRRALQVVLPLYSRRVQEVQLSARPATSTFDVERLVLSDWVDADGVKHATYECATDTVPYSNLSRNDLLFLGKWLLDAQSKGEFSKQTRQSRAPQPSGTSSASIGIDKASPLDVLAAVERHYLGTSYADMPNSDKSVIDMMLATLIGVRFGNADGKVDTRAATRFVTQDAQRLIDADEGKDEDEADAA